MRHRAMVMLGFFAAFAAFLLLGLFLLDGLGLSVLGMVSIGLSILMILAAMVYTVMGSIQPLWTKRLAQKGLEARAIVITNNAVKGIGGYSGSDVWLDLPVKVQPAAEPAFEAKMKCRLTQTLMLRDGSEVTVRYDPSNKNRVVLVGNDHTDMMSKYMK